MRYLVMSVLLGLLVGCASPEDQPFDVPPMPQHGMYPFDLEGVEGITDYWAEMRKYQCYEKATETEYDPFEEGRFHPVYVEIKTEVWDQEMSIEEKIRFSTLAFKAFPRRTVIIFSQDTMNPDSRRAVVEIRKIHGGYIRFFTREDVKKTMEYERGR